jgi:hypothetical protein
MYTYTYTYIHIYIRTYIYTYIYTYMHTYTHAYIHTCIHAYIHTYIHTSYCHRLNLESKRIAGEGQFVVRKETDIRFTYLLTYLLTPWSRVRLEKLTDSQLVK